MKTLTGKLVVLGDKTGLSLEDDEGNIVELDGYVQCTTDFDLNRILASVTFKITNNE